MIDFIKAVCAEWKMFIFIALIGILAVGVFGDIVILGLDIIKFFRECF